MVKSRRPKKTTTKKPAAMPTLPRPAPLESSTVPNVITGQSVPHSHHGVQSQQGGQPQRGSGQGQAGAAGGVNVGYGKQPPLASGTAEYRSGGHAGSSNGHVSGNSNGNGHGASVGASRTFKPAQAHTHATSHHRSSHSHSQTNGNAHAQINHTHYVPDASEPGDTEIAPPPTSIDPLDPRFRAAWQEWTTSALGRLDQLPKLSQNQLAAIARAAAAGVNSGAVGALSVGNGAGNALLEGSSSVGVLGPNGESSEMALQALQGGTDANGQQVLGIDLPASLAALFEAKLTLDREKAKLVRMQKELQGYRAAAGRMKEEEEYCHCECHECHHDHEHEHDHEHDHDHDHPLSGEEDEYEYEYEYSDDYPCTQHGCTPGRHNHPPEDEDEYYEDDEEEEEDELPDDGPGGGGTRGPIDGPIQGSGAEYDYDDADSTYAQPQLVDGSAMTFQHPMDQLEWVSDGTGVWAMAPNVRAEDRQRVYRAAAAASLPPIADDPERLASLLFASLCASRRRAEGAHEMSPSCERMDATVAQLFNWIKAVVSMHR